jgi:hypothetical protein
MIMTMTEKLATNLIDSLACVAISAIGYDAYMEDEENLRPAVEEYAHTAFMDITDTWENATGIKWKIYPNNENESEEWEIG